MPILCLYNNIMYVHSSKSTCTQHLVGKLLTPFSSLMQPEIQEGSTH